MNTCHILRLGFQRSSCTRHKKLQSVILVMQLRLKIIRDMF